MQDRRIQIIGASGSGTTTLGRALAVRLAAPHHDTDDFYWRPTTPPFSEPRPVKERARLMRDMFIGRPDWILSGSTDGWGDDLIPLPDLLVYINTPTDLRLQRLHQREVIRYGKDAIAEGGWRHEQSTSFLEWASHYEASDREGRNRARQEAWMAKLTCPVLRLDGTRQTCELVDEIVREFP